MSDIPGRLDALRTELNKIHELIHHDNNTAGQTNPHLREAVSATSAALAAVQRAHRHAERAYAEEGQQR